MKIDLSTIFEMIEEEDKKTTEDNKPLQLEKKTALDLQGLFSLFEQLEPTINAASNSNLHELKGAFPKKPDVKDLKTDFEELNLSFRLPRIQISDRVASDTSDKRELDVILDGLVGPERPDIFSVLKKIKEVSENLQQQNLDKTSTRELISSLMMLESLYMLYNSFDPRAVGFINESFSAALYGGVALDTAKANSKGIIADVFDQEGIPISIKTIAERPNLSDMGSRANLVNTINIYGKVYFDFFFKTKIGQTVGSLKFMRVVVDKNNINEFDEFNYSTNDQGILGAGKYDSPKQDLSESGREKNDNLYTIASTYVKLKIQNKEPLYDGGKVYKDEKEFIEDYREFIQNKKTNPFGENGVTGMSSNDNKNDFLNNFIATAKSGQTKINDIIKDRGEKLIKLGFGYSDMYAYVYNQIASGNIVIEPSKEKLTMYGQMPSNAGPIKIRELAKFYQSHGQGEIEIEFSKERIEECFKNAEQKIQNETKRIFDIMQKYSDSISKYFLQQDNKAQNANSALEGSQQLFQATSEATEKDLPPKQEDE